MCCGGYSDAVGYGDREISTNSTVSEEVTALQQRGRSFSIYDDSIYSESSALPWFYSFPPLSSRTKEEDDLCEDDDDSDDSSSSDTTDSSEEEDSQDGSE